MAKTCLCEGCNLTVWSNGYCKWHQSLRTDTKWINAQAKKKEKIHKPIAKVSAKKLAQHNGNIWEAGQIAKFSPKYAKEVAQYNKRVKVWKLEKPRCAYPGCRCATEDCHHQIGRGANLLDERFWMPLCRKHHDLCKKLAKDDLVALKLIYLRSAKKPDI